jgi:hypothetical protein
MPSGRAYNRRRAAIPELHPRLQSLLDKINADPKASEALRTLTSKGVNAVDILTGLFSFCGGTENELRSGLKYGRNFVRRLRQAVERLREDVELVSQLRREAAKLGIRLYAPAFRQHSESSRGVVDMFDTALRGFSPAFWNVRLGKPGKAKLSAGRADHLASLVYEITEKVSPPSSKPQPQHYALLARLVAAVRGDANPNYFLIQDALRKSVARAQSRRVGPKPQASPKRNSGAR